MAIPPFARPRTARRLLCVGAAVVLFAVLLSRSMHRSLNHDEHQFVTPAALFTEAGLLPYRDYPYFHMPTQVYLYATLSWWTPYKLLVARIVQVACGTAMVLLVAVTTWRTLELVDPLGRSLATAAVAIALVASRFFAHTNGVAWNHDASTLCTVAALLLHVRGLAGARAGSLLASGLLLGGAIGIRLTVAPVAAPFLMSFWLFRSPHLTGRRLRGLLLWSSGMTIGLLPAIVPLVSVPDQFVFGNLRYPQLSSVVYRGADQVALPDKVRFFLFKFIDEPADAAILVAFAAAAAALAWTRPWRGRHRDAVLMNFGVVIALVPGVLAPTPANRQYAYPLLPFMLLAAVHVVASAPIPPARLPARLVAGGLIAVAAISLPGKYTWTDIVGLLRPSQWTPVRQHQLGERIKAATPPDALVLTTTPIPVIEAGLRVYPEFATGVFALLYASLLSPEDRTRYRMVAVEDIGALLDRRPPDAVFFDHPSEFVQAFIEHAERRGYRRSSPAEGSYGLWVRPDWATRRRRRDGGSRAAQRAAGRRSGTRRVSGMTRWEPAAPAS